MGNLFCFDVFCIHSVLTKPKERKNKYKYATANYVTKAWPTCFQRNGCLCKLQEHNFCYCSSFPGDVHSLWKIMISNRNETSKFQGGLIKSLHLCPFHILKHSLSSLSISLSISNNVVPLISVSERSYKCRSFCLLFIISIVMIPRACCRWRYHTTLAYS